MTLPYDIPRCFGAGQPVCDTCARRELPVDNPPRVWFYPEPKPTRDYCPEILEERK